MRQCKHKNEDDSIENRMLRRRVKYLEKQLEENIRTLERICNKLNIKYKKLSD